LLRPHQRHPGLQPEVGHGSRPLSGTSTALLPLIITQRKIASLKASSGPLNILLLSMPDSFEHMPVVAVRMPNGALTSLAGNIDHQHRVAVADLILAQREVRATVERLVREWDPQVVGLSVMTFQRRTALKIVQLVRALKPDIKIVVGGYDPSLAPDSYMAEGSGVDCIVRGEGEVTFRELVRALEKGYTLGDVAGLLYR